MKISTVLWAGVALLCSILPTQGQNQGCETCKTRFGGQCDSFGGTSCVCTFRMGPDIKQVNCSKLIPKCLLMKKANFPGKEVRIYRPESALLDNDALYNPECENDGTFKAKQCNNTDTCWCVNSAGVRRTDRADKETKTCPELVRTFWVIVQMKRNNTDAVSDEDLKVALQKLITERYQLPAEYIHNIEFEGPYIYIDLKQNSTQKVPGDVDIADVGYYMEKDIKGDQLMSSDNTFEIPVNGKNFLVEEPLIMYIDEEPHELSMTLLTDLQFLVTVMGVMLVMLVFIIVGVGIGDLVLRRMKRGRYKKAAIWEMNEMQEELNSEM